MSDQRSDPNERREEPTTEEALPGVDLDLDEEDEQRARETIGPEAADEDEDGDTP